ncbi:SRPBCC family protein [Asticcacaulis sp. BYS171W]|uniref:SRPBCC family protein n=1 Tax=Asticcacaulis aquaticus TaxID=2984212 RepID=A0ABT5HTW0_9CAUL|nr:SRPBCC family protein [Asticcacaulis aquaticus]MDC7682911.1 SRPBCC family protein [Asticcacaulis aquaticus]
MASFRIERTLPYPIDTVYRLVGDMEQYPAFLPGIAALDVTPLAGDADSFDVDVKVGWRMLTERVQLRLTRDPEAQTIRMAQVKGPCRALSADWQFIPQGDGQTIITADVEIDFKNPILRGLYQANQERLIFRLIGAFEARAAALSA